MVVGTKLTSHGALMAIFHLLPWSLLGYHLLFDIKVCQENSPPGSTTMAVVQLSGAVSTEKISFADVLQNSLSNKRLHQYGYMYAQYLDELLDTEVRMLEIGLRNDGASFDLWKSAFSKIKIYGIENSSPGEFKSNTGDEKVQIFNGNQEDVPFLDQFIAFVKKDGGLLDFIVDDGGHTMKQQITSFTHLFPLVKPGGYYFIEHLETSYYGKPCSWGCYGQCCGGGPRGAKGTTVDMIKSFIDVLNSDFQHGPNPKSESKGDQFSVNPSDHLIDSFQCWRNMCMFRRKHEN